MVLDNLKKDLVKMFPIDPEREDGLLSKDFMIKMHGMLYKYKKYGTEMISELNWRERVELLRQAEEIKQAEGESAEAKALR